MSAAGAAEPVTDRGRARRARILAAATRLFDERGFHATSMDDVGAAAGISGPGLYRHVGSKDELLTAVFDGLWTRLRPAAEEAASSSPRDALTGLARAHAGLVVDDPAGLRLLLRELRHVPDAYQRLAGRTHRRWVDAWVVPLRALRPTLSEDDARVLVLAAHGALDAVSVHAAPAGLPLAGRRDDLAAVALRVLDV